MSDQPSPPGSEPPMPGTTPPGKHNSGFFSHLMAALRGETGAIQRLRRKIFEIVEIGRSDNLASKLFDAFIITLILLNIAAFMAETVPSLEAQYGAYFQTFEVFSVAVFTLEYLTRLWTAVEVPFLSRMPAWKARLRFARRPYLVIDLLAILPFYLAQLVSIDLRVLRVLRLLRFFKLSRYSPAMHTLVRVLKNEHRSLSGAALLLVAAVLISATGMYYLEHKEQPDKFGSVPEAAYWAITTLTTVGYGDVTPVTALGKLWAGITMIFGLCILALPVAIISTGFAQEVGRRDFVVTWSLMARIPLLAELDASEVAQVMPLLHANNMPPRTEVISDGSPGDAMFFVAAGQVQLNAKGRIADYRTGDFFGAVALIENDANPGSFATVTKSRLLKLYREDFHRLEQINPAIGAHIRRTAEARRLARGDTGGEPEKA